MPIIIACSVIFLAIFNLNDPVTELDELIKGQQTLQLDFLGPDKIICVIPHGVSARNFLITKYRLPNSIKIKNEIQDSESGIKFFVYKLGEPEGTIHAINPNTVEIYSEDLKCSEASSIALENKGNSYVIVNKSLR